MRVKLQSGESIELSPDAVDRLKSGLRGEVLAVGNAGYEDARRVFNSAIDRRPALIARCKSVADVVAALRVAHEHSILVSVRSGGCDVAGTAVADGGLVVDLSRMSAVHVSPAKKVARVEAGATWADVDRETALYSLAAVGGTFSKVGVAGFTLGGGIGWLSRTHGLACDNVISFDVALADGRIVTASATEHKDLYWALRGGSGNFGIVTSFELQLHEVKPMLGGMAVFPVKQAREVLEVYRTLTKKAPDALALYCALLIHPQAGPVIAVAGCFTGNAVEGNEAIAQLRVLRPVMDAFRPLTYLELQGMLEAPPGFHHSWKSSFAPALTDRTIATLVEQFEQVPQGTACQILIEHLEGAIARVGRDNSAFSHRDERFSILIMGMAPDATGHKIAAKWARTCHDALRPSMHEGVYVNYLSHEADDRLRVKHAYDETTMTRLAVVKHEYDPTNFFRHNHNIKPSSTAATTGDVNLLAPSAATFADLKKGFEALLARFDALEDRVNELEFESNLGGEPKKKPPPK